MSLLFLVINEMLATQGGAGPNTSTQEAKLNGEAKKAVAMMGQTVVIRQRRLRGLQWRGRTRL
jgi:hypothetical protein